MEIRTKQFNIFPNFTFTPGGDFPYSDIPPLIIRNRLCLKGLSHEMDLAFDDMYG